MMDISYIECNEEGIVCIIIVHYWGNKGDAASLQNEENRCTITTDESMMVQESVGSA